MNVECSKNCWKAFKIQSNVGPLSHQAELSLVPKQMFGKEGREEVKFLQCFSETFPLMRGDPTNVFFASHPGDHKAWASLGAVNPGVFTKPVLYCYHY